MKQLLLSIFMCLATVSAAFSTFSFLQTSNNTIPAGGYLLDDSVGFLTNDAPGKLLAR